jgi:WD40 repeat protein
LRLLDVATGKETGLASGAGSVAFSGDGKLLAAASEWAVRLWDVKDGRATPRPLTPEAHGPVQSVAWSPDGDTVAWATPDVPLQVWDVGSGRERVVLPGQRYPYARFLAFHPGGKLLAVPGRWTGDLMLLEAATGKEQGIINTGHRGPLTAAFSPDGKLLATAAENSENAVKLWDVASRACKATLLYERMVHGFAFAPDGKTLVVADDSRAIRVWDVATGKEQAPFKDTTIARAVAFSPDGKTLASSDHQAVKLWDVSTRKAAVTLKHPHYCGGLAFAPDGKSLAAAGGPPMYRGGWAFVWELPSGKALHEWHFPGQVRGPAFAPDGRRLATANANGTVYVLRLR